MINLNNSQIHKLLINTNIFNQQYNQIINYIFTSYFTNTIINLNYFKKLLFKLMNDINDNNFLLKEIYDKSMFFYDFKTYFLKTCLNHKLENIILWLYKTTNIYDNNIYELYAYYLCIHKKHKRTNFLYNLYIDHLDNIVDKISLFINIFDKYNKSYIFFEFLLHHNVIDILSLNNNNIFDIFYILCINYIFNNNFNKKRLLQFYNIYKSKLIYIIDNDFFNSIIFLIFNSLNEYHNGTQLNIHNIHLNNQYTDAHFLYNIDRFNIRLLDDHKSIYITVDYIDKIFDNFYKFANWILIDNEELINIHINNKLLFNILYINYSYKNIAFFNKLLKYYKFTTKLEKNIYYCSINTHVYKKHKIKNEFIHY